MRWDVVDCRPMFRAATAIRIVLLSGVLIAGWSSAGSIFDDDWVPPSKRGSATQPVGVKPPGVAPANPAPEMPTPPTPVPPTPTPPDRPPADPAPSVVPPTAPKPEAKNPASNLPKPPVTPTPIVRRPMPAKADLDKSRAVLKEAFAEQLADKALPARRKLADVLLTEAAKAGSNAPDQFVLYGGAINAAKEAASLPLVFRAADELGKLYDVEPLQTKLTAVTNMPLKADSPAGNLANVSAGLDLLDAMLADDDLPTAAKLCIALRAPAAGDKVLLDVVNKRTVEIDQRRSVRDRVAGQIDRLKIAPLDPGANLAAGSYYCFSAGQWARGLPLLAKGSDAVLKKLATDDLAGAADSATALRLGDEWWNAALKQLPAVQPTIKRHAADFYLASGELTPLLKIKVDKRLAEVNDSRKADPVVALRDQMMHQKSAALKAFAQSAGAKAGATKTPLPVDDPVKGDVTWKADTYSIPGEVWVGYNGANNGRKKPDAKSTLKVAPGTVIEGGAIRVSDGRLELLGDAANPIIVRNVKFSCELTGVVKGTFVIFDHCEFSKEGGFGWIGFPNAKFVFEDCLLQESNFKKLGWDDYGIKFTRSTFNTCKLPRRYADPDKNTKDMFKRVRHEFNRIVDCDFYACDIATSVYWATQGCNFYRCKPTDNAIYFSPTDVAVELGFPADERETSLLDLRKRTTATDAGQIRYATAPSIYPSQAWPRQ